MILHPWSTLTQPSNAFVNQSWLVVTPNYNLFFDVKFVMDLNIVIAECEVISVGNRKKSEDKVHMKSSRTTHKCAGNLASFSKFRGIFTFTLNSVQIHPKKIKNCDIFFGMEAVQIR
jgi:hypothetical protein